MELGDIKLIADNGMGFASFVVLLYAVVRFLKFMDVFLSNHMTHVQDSIEKISSSVESLDKRLEKTVELFERHLNK